MCMSKQVNTSLGGTCDTGDAKQTFLFPATVELSTVELSAHESSCLQHTVCVRLLGMLINTDMMSLHYVCVSCSINIKIKMSNVLKSVTINDQALTINDQALRALATATMAAASYSTSSLRAWSRMLHSYFGRRISRIW